MHRLRDDLQSTASGRSSAPAGQPVHTAILAIRTGYTGPTGLTGPTGPTSLHCHKPHFTGLRSMDYLCASPALLIQPQLLHHFPRVHICPDRADNPGLLATCCMDSPTMKLPMYRMMLRRLPLPARAATSCWPQSTLLVQHSSAVNLAQAAHSISMLRAASTSAKSMDRYCSCRQSLQHLQRRVVLVVLPAGLLRLLDAQTRQHLMLLHRLQRLKARE